MTFSQKKTGMFIFLVILQLSFFPPGFSVQTSGAKFEPFITSLGCSERWVGDGLFFEDS